MVPMFEVRVGGGVFAEGWVHLGGRRKPPRDPALPGCRVATWFVEKAYRLDGGPTQPTLIDADILAIEPDEPIRRPPRQGI